MEAEEHERMRRMPKRSRAHRCLTAPRFVRTQQTPKPSFLTHDDLRKRLGTDIPAEGRLGIFSVVDPLHSRHLRWEI